MYIWKYKNTWVKLTTHIHSKTKTNFPSRLGLRLGLWNTPTAPLQCPGYNTKQSDGEVLDMLELLGMQSIPPLPLLPSLLWPGVVAPNRVLYMGQIELNWEPILNWIAWNRTVLKFRLRTYAKLNCLKYNSFCTQNWIVWNGIVYLYKNGFGIK